MNATYQVGDRLHFRPSPDRGPFGTAISEGEVIVTQVVDHGPNDNRGPRFTYVVRALDPSMIIKSASGLDSDTQGTDDRELEA